MKTVITDIFLKQLLNIKKKLFNGVALNGIAFIGMAFRGIALNLHRDLPFLPGRNKIKKCNKLVCNIYDKENCVVHKRALKQSLNHV